MHDNQSIRHCTWLEQGDSSYSKWIYILQGKSNTVLTCNQKLLQTFDCVSECWLQRWSHLAGCRFTLNLSVLARPFKYEAWSKNCHLFLPMFDLAFIFSKKKAFLDICVEISMKWCHLTEKRFKWICFYLQLFNSKKIKVFYVHKWTHWN